MPTMTMALTRWRRGLAAAALLVFGAGSAAAQQFPSRPITLILPFAAGGASDVSSRIMGEAMGKILGQSLVIENVAGAGGATGSLRGRNAAPDGYTIGFGHMGTHAASVATNPKLLYDPRKDFGYLGVHLATPNLLIVREDFPAQNLPEFIAYAKEKKKGLKIGHNGLGSLCHLTCLLFFQLIDGDPPYVVDRGFGQTINDILSGAIDGICDLVASVTGHVKGGSVRAFALATDQRSPALADVPTAAEGGLPAFKADSWLGLYAPENLPPAVLAKFPEAAVKALDDPTVRSKFLEIGGTVPKPEDRGGERMLQMINADVTRWSEVVRKAGGVEDKPN